MNKEQFVEIIREHRNKVILLIGVILVIALALLAPRIKDGVRGIMGNRVPAGCAEGFNFSPDNGKPCPIPAEVLADLPEGCKPGYNFSETTGEPCATEEEKEAEKSAPKAAPSSYEAALKAYEGKVVAFGASCVATPAELTVAPGTRIMVTNNGKSVQNVKLGDRSIALRPLHYFTQSLAAGTHTVTCNGEAKATVIAQ